MLTAALTYRLLWSYPFPYLCLSEMFLPDNSEVFSGYNTVPIRVAQVEYQL